MSTDWQPPAERWYFLLAGAVVLWVAVWAVLVLTPACWLTLACTGVCKIALDRVFKRT